ncbi:MAG: hypothetical protein IBX55_18670 [Methyloprofundus sp.]|nr:hypothetical protein [Methyloprofundus sp.]
MNTEKTYQYNLTLEEIHTIENSILDAIVSIELSGSQSNSSFQQLRKLKEFKKTFAQKFIEAVEGAK